MGAGGARRGALGRPARRAALAVARGARAGDLQSLLLHDPATWREPYDFHERVRARGPLVTGRFTRMSAHHDVVREVLGSGDFGVGARDDVGIPWLRSVLAWAGQEGHVHPVEPPSMLAVDPPDHTRYRRLVSKVSTARAVEGLRGRVQALADELLDALAARLRRRAARQPGGHGALAAVPDRRGRPARFRHLDRPAPG